jgi:HlyD family secretion protein
MKSYFRCLAIPTAFILLAGSQFSCKNGKTAVRPETRDIVESVYASASIKAAEQYTVIAPVSGLLLRNAVNEGDSVVAGQLVAQIENANPGLNAENARLAVELAEKNMGNLTELENQIRTSRTQVTLDSTNYHRQLALWNKNIGSKTQVEARQLAYEASKNNLASLQTRYRQQKIQLQLSVSQARNNYGMMSKTNSDFSITSKINGRVYALNYEPGELVSPQKPIALIGRAGQFMLELTVDEVDISRIALGQKVVIAMDAYRDQVFEGKISKIYPNLDIRSQSFLVEAEFVSRPAVLYPGMSAEANIVVREKKNAMVIPLVYLKENNMVSTEDGDKKVVTGIRSMEFVEIVSGLDKTAVLVKP